MMSDSSWNLKMSVRPTRRCFVQMATSAGVAVLSLQAGSRMDLLLCQPLQGGFRFLRHTSLGGA